MYFYHHIWTNNNCINLQLNECLKMYLARKCNFHFVCGMGLSFHFCLKPAPEDLHWVNPFHMKNIDMYIY